MQLYFEQISTKSDLELIKYWLDDIDLLRLARMRENPLTEEELQQYLVPPSFIIYVNGLACGYARIFRTQDPKIGEMGIVIAWPEYRGKGIGEKVGAKILAACLTMGFKKINWATSDNNMASINLAKKLGFVLDIYLPDVITLNGESRSALIFKYEV